MRLSTRIVLQLSYYYSLLLGIISYHCNYKTGRVYTTRALTFHSIAMNLLLVASVPLLFTTNLKDQIQEKTQYLNRYIFVVMTIVRTCAVLITLLLNWMRRSDFIAVTRTFRRWRQRYSWHASIERRFESLVVKKFLASWISDTTMWGVMLDAARNELTWQLGLSISALTVFTSVLNLVINHYYFAILHIVLHAQILNEELVDILKLARLTDKQRRQRHHRRPGAFINKCCQLTDQLDALAVDHHRLHKLTDRINKMYEVQGLCVTINMYLNTISSFFIIYTFVKPGSHLFDMSWMGIILMVITNLSYYYDMGLFSRIVMEVLEVTKASGDLLKRRMPLSLMDVRLERSFENFLLQMVRHPVEMHMCGLLQFNKQFQLTMVASTITNTIFLMQLDYKIS